MADVHRLPASLLLLDFELGQQSKRYSACLSLSSFQGVEVSVTVVLVPLAQVQPLLLQLPEYFRQPPNQHLYPHRSPLKACGA